MMLLHTLVFSLLVWFLFFRARKRKQDRIPKAGQIPQGRIDRILTKSRGSQLTNMTSKPPPRSTLVINGNFRKPFFPKADDVSGLDRNEIRKTLERTAAMAIVFRRIYPPDHPFRSASYFGGRPKLPAEIAWPIDSKTGEGLAFLAQIDLKSLPALQCRDLLPNLGTLFFFVSDPMDGLVDRSRVVFLPESVVELPEREPPAHVYFPFGTGYLNHFEGQKIPLGHRLTDYPRSAVEPVTMMTFAEEMPGGANNAAAGVYQEFFREVQSAELIKTFGHPLKRPGKLHGFFPTRNGSLREVPGNLPFKPIAYRELFLVDPAWPFAWICVEIFAGLLKESLNDEKSRLEYMRKNATDIIASALAFHDDRYRQALDRAQAWLDEARSEGWFTGPRADRREEFRSWVRSIAAPNLHIRISQSDTEESGQHDTLYVEDLNRHTDDALQECVQHCLAHSREAAAHIPTYAVELTHWRHAALIDSPFGGARRHQMFGNGRDVQGAPERFKDTHLLLLQLDSDEGMSWMFGDAGVVQFWITPEDLKAQRFENAVITLEGH